MSIGFIHIPKNGGSSVKQWFADQHIDLITHGHNRFDEVDSSSANWWFAMCRNPYHRVISYYEFSRVKAQRVITKNRGDDNFVMHQDVLELCKSGFENWVLHYGYIVPQFTQTQLRYITAGTVKVNYVLKLENLQREWRTIKIITGVDAELGRTNVTEKSMNSYYTKTSQEFVCEMFRDDFEYFKYSPDLPAF